MYSVFAIVIIIRFMIILFLLKKMKKKLKNLYASISVTNLPIRASRVQ